MLATALGIAMFYAACSIDDSASIKVDQEIVSEMKGESPNVSGKTCDFASLSCDHRWPSGACDTWAITVNSPGTCDVTFAFSDGTHATRQVVFGEPEGCGRVSPNEVPPLGLRDRTDAGPDSDVSADASATAPPPDDEPADAGGDTD